MNGRTDVSEVTRSRVLDAAKDLNFVPNTLAKSLLTGRTGTVGLITHDFEGRFSIPLLMGAEDAFGLNKVSVLLCDARGDAIRERYHLGVLMQRRVDGLIIVGARPDTRQSLGSDIPFPSSTPTHPPTTRTTARSSLTTSAQAGSASTT
nr:LacI family DNA-binding transcriptional regulator [Tessaracoccus coleopterorum]